MHFDYHYMSASRNQVLARCILRIHGCQAGPGKPAPFSTTVSCKQKLGTHMPWAWKIQKDSISRSVELLREAQLFYVALIG